MAKCPTCGQACVFPEPCDECVLGSIAKSNFDAQLPDPPESPKK